MPVTTVEVVSFRPTISTVSFSLTTPRSMRPVATVPRPVIENTSSMDIRKGLSISRTGSGISESMASMRSLIAFTPSGLPSRAAVAEPRMIFAVLPSNWYLVRRSRISSSTRSRRSGSSIRSTLFRKTTIFGTPTWRARRMCSRVCGIGPSAAETTRIAPSIWAAPVIMFLTKSACPGQSTWA